MPNGQLMEVVKKHLQAGTLPDDITQEFIAASVVELYGEVAGIKNVSSKNATAIRIIAWVGCLLMTALGGLIFALAQKALGG